MGYLEETEMAFSGIGEEYSFRKELAEHAVSEFCCSALPWYDPRPLYFERHKLPVGRRMRMPPQNPNSLVACGIDGAGHVVVERLYTEFGTLAETFYKWGSSLVEVACFDSSERKNAVSLVVVRLEGGRAVSSSMAAIHGHVYEEYAWNNTLVFEVRVARADRQEDGLAPLEPLHIARATYDEGMKVRRVELLWAPSGGNGGDSEREVVFERRGKRILRGRR